jgi:NAD(P)-dependent dehydrogenase (short-subunit alcohol dehydrogenase family)
MNGVITGAASGIGLATAVRLADDARRVATPARLVLVDRDRDRLGEATKRVRDRGAEVASLVLDLFEPAAADEVARVCHDRYDRLDVLVSNAGIAEQSMLTELDAADYDRTFAINTRATWLLAKALHPLLRAGRGAIVATASIAAEEPSAPMGAYSASKAALVMLVRQMAYEWGPDGIRCNCVSPGMTHTGLTDGTYSDPVKRAERASQIPLRRVADPEDIASVIAFLAGPDAAYVTGVNLVVDGGVQTSLLPTIRGLVGV